jgi:hypothetical protein
MKKQVATWIVAGTLVVGIGAAFAQDPPAPGASTDPTSTSVEETTTVAPTTTTVDSTTTTTVADTTTTVGDTSPTVDTVDPATSPTVAGDWPGNSWAAQNHDCDANWGNHGAWVSANAQARRTGTTVPCDPNAANQTANADTTSTTVAGDTTSTTVATSGAVTQQSTTTGHGKSGGHGKKH